MRRILVGLIGLVGAIGATLAFADDFNRKYEVTLTNITRGQTFTPQLVATHTGKVALFELGDAASLELEILAEGGDTAPLTAALLGNPNQIGDIQTIPGLLGPGESVTILVEATQHHRFLSVAAMLIPTNDTFVALDGVRLPRRGATHKAVAYDAGTEANDQDCANIPGPRCGGAGYSPGPNEGDEGYVYVGNGFHDLPADSGEILGPLVYDWRNPVAEVVVRRIL